MRKEKKFLAVVLCFCMVLGVWGCGKADEPFKKVNFNAENEGTKENNSNKEENNIGGNNDTENTDNKITEPTEKSVYTVSSYTLSKIAQEFFMIQAKQIFDSELTTDDFLPVTLNEMRNRGNRLNIVSDWDENNFSGLKHTCHVMLDGLAMKSGYVTNYNLSVTNVMNNFNDTYRYYIDSDAVLIMAVKIKISSSVEHDSSSKKDNYGYAAMSFRLAKGTTDSWKIAGVSKIERKGGEESDENRIRDIEKFGWKDYMLHDEDLKSSDKNGVESESNYADAQNDREWKQPYIDYFKSKSDSDNKGYSGDWSFKLLDINEDGKPEIFVLDMSRADGDHVFCIDKEGKVQQTIFEEGIWQYEKDRNLVLISGGHMDHYFDYVYTIDNKGCFSQVHTGIWSNEWFSGNIALTEPIAKYSWDGKEVDEETYNKSLKEAFDENNAIYINEGNVFKESDGKLNNILNIIEGIKYDDILARNN